jgi:hypothetical protein
MITIVSPKQTDFINSLLRDREVGDSLRKAAGLVKTSKEASMLIDAMLKAPRVPRKVTIVTGDSARAEYLAALAGAEATKYAIPTRYLRDTLPRLAAWMTNDLLFLEIRNYGGRKYFSRLTGAPGTFNRSRIPMAEATVLLQFIAGRHVEFSRLFAEHHGVCGRCAADLTDEESRRTGFGPTCRKAFGI